MLPGVDPSNTVTVAVGDVISATVTFDTALSLPGSTDFSFFALDFFGTNLPNVNFGTSNDAFQLFHGSTLVASASNYISTTNGILSNVGEVFAPDNGPLSFDSAVFSETVLDLSGNPSLRFNQVEFGLGTANLIPEPSKLLLLLLGLTGLAVLARWRPARLKPVRY